jgi:glycosyltransferase involved in cell wall biosynthesis
MTPKIAIVSVTNDLSTDRRVDNTCTTLQEMGFNVLLVGRHRQFSNRLSPRSYQTHRFRLLFEKGFLFYAEYNSRLFLFLVFRKTSLLVSNDLDTLLPNYLVSFLRRIPLVYDTHEFFTGVPELTSRPGVRRVWERIEKWIFPKLKYVITVNNSISGLYKDLYGKELIVIRNVPPKRDIADQRSRKELGLPEDKPIILLQGAWINADRGGEEAVDAMAFLDHVLLLIIGAGDVIDVLKEKAKHPSLSCKVMFIPRLPFEQLFNYTVHADIGLTLDKDTNINYRFSLPNKLFDYIQAGVPVLASSLKEICAIIEKYSVGECIATHAPEHIALRIQHMLADKNKLQQYRENCLKAREELCWEVEKEKLAEVYSRFL